MKKIFWISLLLLIIFSACKKKSDDNNANGSDADLTFLSNVIVLQDKAVENYATWSQTMDTLEAINQLQQFFLSDPTVISATIGSQGIAVQYSNGMRGGVFLNPEDEPGKDTLDIRSGPKMPLSGLNGQSLVNIKKVIFLNPHYLDRKYFADKIIAKYSDCLPKVGFALQTIYKNDEATVDRFAQLSGYGIIHVYSHGWAWPEEKKIEEVFLLTGESVNDNTSKKYKSEIKSGDIMILRTTDNKYCLSSKFIASHNDFSKDTVLFYGGFCYSFLGKWDQLSQKFAKGSYFGFDWSVKTDWNAAWANSLVDSLCDTVSRPPYNPEKWIIGPDIPKSYWYEQENKTVSIHYAGDATLTLWKSFAAIVTNSITNITQTTAISGGNIKSDGGFPVTARGVCWSTSANPTTANSQTSDGSGTGVFTSSLSGLTANTPYYVRAYSTNSGGTVYGNEVTFTTLQNSNLPSLTTTAISSITQTTAIGGGNVTSDGGTTVTARGVCWSTAQNPGIADNKTMNGSGTGSYTSELSGLIANTPYYVRAYATNSVGTVYGNQVAFNTLQNPVLPTVSTTSITNITQTTATSGGNVTSDGGTTVTARGVCWSTAQNPDIADNKTMNGGGTGSFTSDLSGLTANTPYYVRAYATNSLGTVYGNQVSFTTSNIAFYIGQSYGGGIIFYIDGTGQHGLISATSDQSTGSPWGCSGTAIGGTSREIGTGQANTTIIVNACSEVGIAARICNDLVLNGYEDWFLPSKYELYEMFLRKNIIGGFAATSYYTSSEDGACCAWFQKFIASGGGNSDYKYTNYYVRAVRAF